MKQDYFVKIFLNDVKSFYLCMLHKYGGEKEIILINYENNTHFVAYKR